MTNVTTIKVSVRTRDALRELAIRDGLTFDQLLEWLIRRERKRRMGEQLSCVELDEAELAVLDASGSDIAHSIR